MYINMIVEHKFESKIGHTNYGFLHKETEKKDIVV
jgi:hypothetical protein